MELYDGGAAVKTVLVEGAAESCPAVGDVVAVRYTAFDSSRVPTQLHFTCPHAHAPTHLRTQARTQAPTPTHHSLPLRDFFAYTSLLTDVVDSLSCG